MKRISLIIIAVLCVALIAKAQSLQHEYRPFAQDGKVWQTQVGFIEENLYGNIIDGDTVINGETWKKVYNYVGFPDFDYTYYAAVRDEGKKVYAIANGSKRPRLLYDFNLEEGSMVKCGIEGNAFGCLLDKGEMPDTLLGFPFIYYLKVEHIDTIEARGLKHRRFTLSLLDAFEENYITKEDTKWDYVIWVEGVGSGAGPFSPWMPLPPRNSILLSCEINRTCVFAYPDFYDADVSNAVNSPSISTYPVSSSYDLSGRPVSGKPQRGLYIQGGRIKATK